MKIAAALLLLAAAGCSHAEPFGSGTPHTASGPFSDAVPLHLTYNIGADWTPAWAPDGLSIYYSAQDSFRVDRDRCIARLPATAGTRQYIACPALAENDTTEILQQPAPDDSMVVYARSELGVGEHAPFRFTLWSLPRDGGAAPQLRFTFPYDAPTGLSHDAPLFLQWIRPGVLLYLGAQNGCCQKDSLRFGEEVVLLDLRAAVPAPSFVPGTFRASSVAGSRDGTAIYYTFYGDSRVFRQVLATGEVTLLHDFGAGRIARDVQVAGNLLVAVVDGKPNYRDVDPFGLVQVDNGGLLSTVDLSTGVETRLPDGGRLYRRPVLSPAGDRMVVEGYPFQTIPLPGGVDTVVSKWADLWLLEE